LKVETLQIFRIFSNQKFAMRFIFLVVVTFLYFSVSAQQLGDTVLKPCPVFITDTVSSNNFFIEALPVTLRVFRVKGELTIQFQQRDQYFTLFFHMRKLRDKNYTIDAGSGKRKEVEAAYSFKSGDQVSFISVSNGKLDVNYDKQKAMWHLKVDGVIKNMVERSVTYYKVKADFTVK